ncbi:YcdB/YcdC domain-containing protein [Ureibacillus aquaedulcis]|uniref:PepSY domain-containing protein n=1 Tax=Ureibacillus aquaedulcis TaxID=3058421 RepID=A0ABT8GUM4_9BACL|nr:YcdB/YcdC domain-containing protein [Ureibacillus sp. BA0131]MDN4495118.1 PepSY domain-containing protein [Ureibacillus sp. BA0131]
MKNLRTLGILTLSTGLSFGALAPAVAAATPANEQNEMVQIRTASVESVVTKSELIKKFKELFPNKFDFLNDGDFHMGSGHHFPDDDTIRYDLSFHKEINGKRVYGGIGFVGEELEIENFYYQPANSIDALFPAKVTKGEAEEAALAFLKKIPGASEYQLDTTHDYNLGNQPLTEPIRYSFSFVRTENQVPIPDQHIQVNVLGNGEIADFYRTSVNTESHTFDDITKVISENEILTKVKENLAIDLQYRIDFDYQTGDRTVQLVYQPTNDFLGVHALSGEWQTVNGFSPDLPEEQEIEFITAEPIQPKQTDFSLEKAKAFAQKLLSIDSDKVKLSIESIEERENHIGQEVIAIQYMYYYGNSGHGTELELDKQTGEIIQYTDIKSDVLREMGDNKENNQPISSEEALNLAVEYLKEFSPSHLHNYAKPTGEAHFESDRGVYHFAFPRVVDGILVSGDNISVGVSADGSLLGLNVNYQDVENWPTSEEVISEEEAKAEFLEQLSLDLQYVKEGYAEDDDHYQLAYTPLFNENQFSFIDANTGEWNSLTEEESERQVITHPWAEDELNYLVNARILDVEDVNTFDANEKITKGDALAVIMKSLTHFYEGGYYPGQENMSQSFDNIDPEHPLYQIVERAVSLNILDTESANLDLDAHLTREELAVWYIRALGLEQAAKQGSIYQLDFADANDVQKEYIGHVALANSLELLTANRNQFNPNQEVTYAHLAVSVVRLAHEAYKRNPEMYY